MKVLIEAFSANGGILVRRHHPHLASRIDRALRAGLIQVVADGVYAPAGPPAQQTLIATVFAVEPTAVITGRAAAALSWWPELETTGLDVAHRLRRPPAQGIRWNQRRIHPDMVVEQEGLRITDPALTVLDLIPDLEGDAIDEALRRGVVTLADLWARFDDLPPRRGDVLRRQLLLDSRDEPWSKAERGLHRGYRSLRLPYPYFTNHRVDLPDGTYRLLDLAIPDLLQGFEADGFEFHGTHEAFVRDRVSDAELHTITWQRTRFAAETILDDEDAVGQTMLAVVRAREELFRGTRPAGTGVRTSGPTRRPGPARRSNR